MTTEASNHFKAERDKGNIDLANDSIKAILMASGFVFNKDTHATFADVSSSELAAGNGYAQNTKTLGAATVTEDDANDRSDVTFANDPSYGKDVGWTASGGSIGPTPGCILYDDTTADNTIICYIDFGADQTVTNGNNLTIDGIVIRTT